MWLHYRRSVVICEVGECASYGGESRSEWTDHEAGLMPMRAEEKEKKKMSRKCLRPEQLPDRLS